MTIAVVEDPPGTPVVWLDSADNMRHDTRSGTDITTPLTAEEQVRLLVAQIEEGIADLLSAMSDAEGEQVQAQTRAVAATARRDALVAQASAIDTWRQAQIDRAALVGQVASPTAVQLRDELTRVYQRLADVAQQVSSMATTEAQSAGAIAAISTDQAQSAGGLRFALRDLAAVGRILIRVVTRVGADRRES